ncbi:MAG TPA: hypothetical protein VGJ48_06545 [Pyrinomonadaceae bacterium]
MTRLLINTHNPRIERLLDLLDRYGAKAGNIAATILQTNDGMNLERTLAELFLFAHLESRLGGCVQPTIATSTSRVPDIVVNLTDKKVLIEVFSPSDSYGYQVFERYVGSVLKNLPLNIGYTIRLDQQAYDPNYPLDFPEYKIVYKWLQDFEIAITPWIQVAKHGDCFVVGGPAEILRLSVTVKEIHSDFSIRCIESNEPTRSTETKLHFEHFDPILATKSPWFRKIHDKLAGLQAGPPSEEVLRLLALNFRLTDASDFDFLKQPRITANLEMLIRAAAHGITPFLPYDCMIPCALDFDCGFAKPVILANQDSHFISEIISRLQMNKEFLISQ